jgi:hypothetical protein
MSRQDRADGEPADQLVQSLGVPVRAVHDADGRSDAFVDDAARGRPLTAAERAHAVLLLGQVGQLEIETEGASEQRHLSAVQTVQLASQASSLARPGLAASQRDGPASDALDQLQ